MKVLHVVGARPNFMKVAPVMRAIAGRGGIEQRLIHTGQHYDRNMSEIFFEQLGIPEPDINLEVGSASHTVQTAEIMLRFEKVIQEQQPDLVLVYGDINSTMAATLVCAKMGVCIGHVEAGLRSRDRTMSEEINRLVTDAVADVLFTPSPDGDENLLHEGVDPGKIVFVGNVMIDTLVRLLPKTDDIDPGELPERYALVTLHRPSNVDAPEMLQSIAETLIKVSQRLPIVFPIHPRTRNRLKDLNISLPESDRIRLLEPVGYLECVKLQRGATLIITDSGGIQEESTYLGVPCLTVRENTERPITITEGTNVLVGQDMERLYQEVEAILNGTGKHGGIPMYWEGSAGERIADWIEAHFAKVATLREGYTEVDKAA